MANGKLDLKIEGVFVSSGDVLSGTGKTGKEWLRQDFVIEFKDGTFDKKLCLQAQSQAMIDKVAEIGAGESVRCRFNLESRLFNDRWYTTATIWNIEVI